MPIEYSDKNVIYTGEDNEFLGIKSGDSYNTVINKIISNNKKESSPADTNSIVFPGISRASTTSCEGEILNQKIYYSLSEDGFLSYSAKEMISQLKAGYNLSYIEVVIYGTQYHNFIGVINKSTTTENTISISSNNIPLKMAVSIGVNTSCGLIEYKKDILITEWRILNSFSVLDVYNKNNIITFDTTEEAVLELINQVNILKGEIQNLKHK